MKPAERFLALDAERRRHVHVALCERAVVAWERCIGIEPPIYVDSIVGERHTVEIELPRDALEAIRLGADLRDVGHRYGEPIAALQDDDLELPDSIELAWYAVYNAFCRYVLGRPIDDWLIVSQALSADGDPASWAATLEAAIEAAG